MSEKGQINRSLRVSISSYKGYKGRLAQIWMSFLGHLTVSEMTPPKHLVESCMSMCLSCPRPLAKEWFISSKRPQVSLLKYKPTTESCHYHYSHSELSIMVSTAPLLPLNKYYIKTQRGRQLVEV